MFINCFDSLDCHPALLSAEKDCILFPRYSIPSYTDALSKE